MTSSEPKLHNSCPDEPFLIESAGAPFRLDWITLAGGIILFARNDIPAILFSLDISFESSLAELNFSEKRLLNCSYKL